MKANDTQVAGSHYRQQGEVPQHWDLSRMYKWDPMQYQIIKYVMRWKDKHATPEKRLEDLKKARHFLEKYIEDFADYDDHQPIVSDSPSIDIGSSFIDPGYNFPLAVDKPHLSDPAAVEVNTDWQCEGWYGDMTNLYRCKHCRGLFRTRTCTDAETVHGACPKAQGYVNQDK